jgi:ABC transport system ATP-binding/permease protein
VTNPVTEKARAVPKLQARTRRSGHTLHAGTEYRIGRDPDAGIVLDDPRVSWRHAVLRAENGVWILEDSGSKNGTFRDSEQITRLPILTPLLIRLGNPEDGPLLRLDPVIPPPAAEVRPDASQPVPSVDRRPTVVLPLLVRVMRIGRTSDNDLAVDDLASPAAATPAGNRTHRK